MGIDVEEFMCPISMCIMEDPVILAETGVTYERKEITAWFAGGKLTCPCTGVHLKDQSLVPNRALKAAIEKWKGQNEQHQQHEPLNEPRPVESLPTHREAPQVHWLLRLCPCLKAQTSQTSVMRGDPHVHQHRLTPRHITNVMTTAVRNRNIDVLHSMHIQHWSFNSLDDSGRSPLHVATIQNDAYTVDALLRYQALPDFPDKTGCTALHWAARLGNTQCMGHLLRFGAGPNIPNNARATPVHMAAFWGRLQALKMLIESGGDTHCVNERHQRPIEAAMESPWDSAKQAIELLREYERLSRGHSR